MCFNNRLYRALDYLINIYDKINSNSIINHNNNNNNNREK